MPWRLVADAGSEIRVVARREVVTVTDDFDGSDNAATVRFGLDGDTYEVDLSATNEDELRAFLSHYIQVGRRLSASGRPYTTSTGIDPRAVRAWAAASGVTVSPRGRISAEVIDQFHAAGH